MYVMGKFFEEIPCFLFPWIEEQDVFWVASAPLSPEGHVNISPKGLRGSFHIINPNKVWYEDVTGSGESPYRGTNSNCLQRKKLDIVVARHRDYIAFEGKRQDHHHVQRIPRPSEDNKVIWER